MATKRSRGKTAQPKRPDRPDMAVLLFPGAGTSASHASLVAIEDALVAHANSVGNTASVRRMDFPYRLAGRTAPDRAPILVKAVVDAAQEFAAELGCATTDLVIGGRSMGGRMCSIAVAEGLAVRGLACVSYPLHPTGKPDNLRVEHFPNVRVPTLFVSGTRDSFGTPDEFAHHTPSITGPFTQVWIEGGDHSMTKKGDLAAVAVATWVSELS